MKKLFYLTLLLVACWLGAFVRAAPYEKVTVVYFGSPYCGHCQHFEREFLDGFLERNQDKMHFVKVDVTQDNLSFMAALKEYGVEFPGTPSLVVGESFLMGYPQQIGAQADAAVARAVSRGEKTRIHTFSSSGWKTAEEDFPVSAHQNVLKQLTFWMIAGAGLVDGINPCAFAVIVFFISFLSVYKYTRREMLVVGLAYCAAVFAAYVLLGFGSFQFLYALQGFYYVMWAVKAVTVLLCAVFLALSVYDFVHYRRTQDAAGLLLQLPAKYKTFIHKIMHAFLKDRQKSVWRLGFAAVAVGFVVSVVEAVCTGQVYLPTIVVVMKEAGQNFWLAAGYLLFYNLMFILPLAVVFLLAFLGVESKTFGGLLKKHLGLAKALLCLIFAVLLAVLIKTW